MFDNHSTRLLQTYTVALYIIIRNIVLDKADLSVYDSDKCRAFLMFGARYGCLCYIRGTRSLPQQLCHLRNNLKGSVFKVIAIYKKQKDFKRKMIVNFIFVYVLSVF